MSTSVRTRTIIFLAALAALTLIRIQLVTSLHDQSVFAKYLVYAEQWRSGTLPAERLGDVSPAYLLVVSAWQSAGGSASGIWFLQVVLVSMAALACAFAARRIAGDLAGIVAAALVLANRAAFVNAVEIEPETFILLFHAAGLALLLWAIERPNRSRVAAAGFVLAIPFLFRPVQIVPFAAIVATLFLMRRKDVAVRSNLLPILLPLILVPALFLAMTRFVYSANAPMDPGTVFFEGMNPDATGYAGVQPRIVKELQPTIRGVDTLHETYRLVAAAALGGRESDRDLSNRFWLDKSLQFARAFPLAAAHLEMKKLVAIFTNHDAYDLAPSFLKASELSSLWIGFAWLWPLSVAALLLRRNDDRTWLVAAFSAGAIAPMLIFYVTARHRNPLLAGLAILGGIAAADLVKLWGDGDRRRTIAAVLSIVAVAALLHVATNESSEDRHVWEGFFASLRLDHAASQQNVPLRSQQLEAIAWTYRPFGIPPVPASLAKWAAVERLNRESDPAPLFDIAVALQESGAWDLADQVLQRLESIDYRPSRGGRLVNSVAWYRARGLLHLGDREAARRLAAAALSEARGDASVLALDLQLNANRRSGELLDGLHDPFTAAVARAEAAHHAGDDADALRLVERATSAFPAWPRAAMLREEIAKRPAPRTD